MRKLIIVTLLALVALSAVGATNRPSPTNAAEDCDPAEHIHNVPHYLDGVVEYRKQICTQLATGVVTMTIWADGVTPVSTTATPAELAKYLGLTQVAAMEESEQRLNADVDTGQKWVSKLRDWERDAQNYYNQWPTMSDAGKDAVTREMVRRLGLTWGGLADVLTFLDKGR